ncbi:hypothetical protein [Rhizobium sp. WYCCWR 11152]|uniref:hypothetical protein n=1 Tax=Rhizobium sp. WYCCWR 11152 TaxID=2692316 RepID=UPI001AED1751|nr:hypothetical protein [Rhizobium sp. WYCCWR 11152]
MVDNDIALKLCAYASARDLVDLGSARDHSLTMLRVARYAIDRRVQKGRGIRDVDNLRREWSVLSAAVDWIEPTSEEIEFAAELEQRALSSNVELDGGESQLFAILIYRMSPLLLTGDKRAIVALESIGHPLPTERVACLEQVIFTLFQRIGADTLRKRICNEPAVDRSLSISFACYSRSRPTSDVSIEEGLTSYVVSLQRSAPTILIRGTDLSSVVS